MKVSIVDILKAHAGQENLEVVVEAPASTSVETDLENPQSVIESMNSSDELDDAAPVVQTVETEAEVIVAAEVPAVDGTEDGGVPPVVADPAAGSDTVVGDVVVEGEVVPAAVEAAVEENAEEHAEIHQEIDAAELANELEHKRMENAIADNTREINQMSEVVEAIEEDVEELTDVVDGLECLLEQPTMNRPAANYLFHRANKLHVKLGGTAKEQVAGQESLESEEAYRAVIRDAISGNEGFMESVKKGANALKELARRIWEALVATYLEATDVGKRLSKDITEVRGKLDSGELLETIKVTQSWSGVVDITENAAKLGDEAVTAFNKLYGALLNVHITTDDSLISSCKALQTAANGFNITNTKTRKEGDLKIVEADGVIGMRVPQHNIESLEDATKFLKGFRMTAPKPVDFNKVEEAKQLRSKQELSELLDVAAALLENTERSAKGIRANEKIILDTTSKVETTKEREQAVRAYLSFATAYANFQTRNNVRIVRGMISYVKACIK